MTNKQETERQLLALALRGEAKLTPAIVAYRLELPLAEAKARLEELTSQGVLELESDERGGLRYTLVGDARIERDEPSPRKVSAPAPPSTLAFLAVLAALVTVVHLLLTLLPTAGLLGVAYSGMAIAGYLAARQLIRWASDAPRSMRAD